MGPVQNPGKGERGLDPIRLPVRSGIRESRLEFYYHYSNFLVYGGAGSGKTKSIGKWLLSEYMRLGFAGFIYDFKDTDYTRTAYNLIKRHRYPHKFYYVSFDRPERSYRFNPLKVVRDRTELIQLMEDVLLALLPKKEQPERMGSPEVWASSAAWRSGSGTSSPSIARCRIYWPSS